MNTATKLLAAIETSKTRPLERLIIALGIPLVGERTAKDLATHFRTLEALRHCQSEQLVEIPDIGPKTAVEVAAWFDPAAG